MRRLSYVGFALALTYTLTIETARADTLTVGPGKTYAMPCAAFAAAMDGDVIEIDAAGSYDGDVCAITKNALTIRGVNGRAQIDAAGNDAQGKGIWVVQGDNTRIENIELSGATVPDMNGAGIRQEGQNLTVRGCYFHDNENGILAGDVAGSQILIEYTEFDHNGAGDGYSHNLYINHVAKLTFQFNYSHSAQIGHLLKTRAAENYVLYNRLTGESDGTQSYEVDVPNGGKTYVIGNLIEQGVGTDNPNMLAYLEEGTHADNPSDALFVVNNTFVNDEGSGTFVSVGGDASTAAVLTNNIFFGGGAITNQGSAVLSNNHSDATSCLVDAANFDYHLAVDTPCIDAGVDPGDGDGFALLPGFHYVHPAGSTVRTSMGTIDIGAYEGGVDLGIGGMGGMGGTAGSGGASGGSGAAGDGSGGASGGSSSGGVSSAGSSNASGGSAGNGAANAGSSSTSSSSKDDGGCGCRLGAGANAVSAGWLLAALSLTLGVRRRRRQAPP